MHELAITSRAWWTRSPSGPAARRWPCVRLRVGRLAGVVPDAMRFCFELVTAGTPLEGAALGDRAAGGAGALPHPAARRSCSPT